MFPRDKQQFSGSGSRHQMQEGAPRDGGQFTPPSISLPKGGGALRGIGETFSVNAVTGTGALSVPLPLSPGRNGFAPNLALSYDSGAGNGPFGLGWSLSLPSISRRTDRGLPRYLDDEESDTFMLSGSEELVPALVREGPGLRRRSYEASESGISYTVYRYEPRVESSFARIERWVRVPDGDTHWRVTSPADVTNVYGRHDDSRISDPEDASRVFQWLICETYDGKGNAISYVYAREDLAGVDTKRPSEQQRVASANRYLKRVRYANRTPRVDGEDLALRDDWLFEAVLDYGDHGGPEPAPSPTNEWPVREDAFSSYRSGFEVRTYRLCRRVLMFHMFSELGDTPYLVSSLDLPYRSSPSLSVIDSLRQRGYVRRADGSYLSDAEPSLDFSYTEAVIDETVKTIDPESLANLPAGLAEGTYGLIDLYGDGVPGILARRDEAWSYKRNLSPVATAVADPSAVRFGPAELVATVPALATGIPQQFLDLSGDGQLDLVQFEGSTPGFFEHDGGDGWQRFTSFDSLPKLAWDDPNLRLVDLTGDGLADLLLTKDRGFVWHPSLGERGFGEAQHEPPSLDESAGPRLVFADGTQSVYLADMSGDGLSDLVRIRNQDVCYWPNLGYGHFGARITMENPPWFDLPDQFDQRRIRLADIDGTGVTDIIYLGRGATLLFFNQSGNAWSEPRELQGYPAVDNVADVRTADLLGNGTACLLWSSPLPGESGQQMRYINLMGAQKPHLMTSIRNNLGAETLLHYAPSTSFQLRDQQAGRPWITRLHFPVHVVDRVDTIDRVSGNRFVRRYAYHHGYFDGKERDFRGFAMVEELDTQEFTALAAENAPRATNLDAASHVAPVLTKTWFHTGAYALDKDRARRLALEYYGAPLPGSPTFEAKWQAFEATLLPDNLLPYDLSADELPEASRALRGSVLRQEVYGLDGPAAAPHPYSVAERSYRVVLRQPRGPNRHASFLSHPVESVSYAYERKAEDPRVTHELFLEVDTFGNILRSASIAYGRRLVHPALSAVESEAQTRSVITCTETTFTNAIDTPIAYRIPAPCETQTYELTGLNVTGPHRGMFEAVDAAMLAAAVIDYDDAPSGGLEKRLIEHERRLYRRNDLSGPLELCLIESLGLPFERYRLALTDAIIAARYEGRVDAALLREAGYLADSDGRWWIPSGRIFHSPRRDDDAPAELAEARRHFFQPRRYVDAFRETTTIDFDDYDLLLVRSTDAVGNVTSVENDYRVLKPRVSIDANGNRAATAFDALGRVVLTAVMGKAGEAVGDQLDVEHDLAPDTTEAFFADPVAQAPALLGGATTRVVYDQNQFFTHGRPIYAATLSRETHLSDPLPATEPRIQVSFSYSDGFGREVQHKTRAEPGPLTPEAPDLPRRWTGSGWIVFDNKGNQVKNYEPFFSATHEFEFDARRGVGSTLIYDPLGRVVVTLHPDRCYEKAVFDAWRHEDWDANDTVLFADPKQDPDAGAAFARLDPEDYLPSWHTVATSSRDADLRAAAGQAAAHASTPRVSHVDSLGRVFLTVEDNGGRGAYHTRIELDVEGNARAVIDPKGRRALTYEYDMSGTRVRQHSIDAGTRWLFHAVDRKLVAEWDSRGYRLRHTFDALRRPTALFASLNGGEEMLAERTIYGEPPAGDSAAAADAQRRNLRGRAWLELDGAGLLSHDAYDFKGNGISKTRRFARSYRARADWTDLGQTVAADLLNQAAPLLEDEAFTTTVSFDALNRPIATMTADGSVTRASYNEAGLLDRLSVEQAGAVGRNIVRGFDYSARGQRTRAVYGNGVVSTYTYDDLTFRLVRVETRGGGRAFQSLQYIYDPEGNVTAYRDDAQQTVYFDNAVSEPHRRYVYDALYRLVEARGRERIAQVSPAWQTWDDAGRIGLLHPGDGRAMRPYRELYTYDEVGAIQSIVHHATGGEWVRTYDYDPGSNRLASTTVEGITERFAYDDNGNALRMDHLPQLVFDFEDQLQTVDLGGGGRAFYIYDLAGRRLRKVIERQNGTLSEQRFYLDGYELFRSYNGLGQAIDLERQTLHIFDGERRVALIDTRSQGNDASPTRLTSYQYDDHLGSACLQLDDAGNILSYEEYYPYGGTSYQARDASVRGLTKRYRYIGKERDEETGLYHFGARYYAPWLGRWMAPDQAWSAEESNLYVFVHNNPIKFTDSDGNEPEPASKKKSGPSAGDILAFVAAVILSVPGYILGGGSANAPSRNDLRRLERQPSNAEIVGRGLVASGSGSLGAAVGARVLGRRYVDQIVASTGRRVLARSVGGAAAGGSFGVGALGIEDAKRGRSSGFLAYAATFGVGVGLGVVAENLLGPLGIGLVRPRRPSYKLPRSREEARDLQDPVVGQTGNPGERTGVAAYVKGQKTEQASTSEAIRFQESVNLGVETSRSNVAGVYIKEKGAPTSVELSQGPTVRSTEHTHQDSGLALLSKGDIQAFQGAVFAPGATHTVLGLKFPQAYRFLSNEGLTLPPGHPIVLRTKVSQSDIVAPGGVYFENVAVRPRKR